MFSPKKRLNTKRHRIFVHNIKNIENNVKKILSNTLYVQTDDIPRREVCAYRNCVADICCHQHFRIQASSSAYIVLFQYSLKLLAGKLTHLENKQKKFDPRSLQHSFCCEKYDIEFELLVGAMYFFPEE